MGIMGKSWAVWACLAVLAAGLPIEQNDKNLGETTQCFEAENADAKATCCLGVLNTWRSHQALYTDMERAETEHLTSAEENSKLRAAADAAKATYEASDTAKLYREGIRDCVNSETLYKLPEAPSETTARKEADGAFEEEAQKAKDAHDTIEKNLKIQADSMAKFAKIDEELRDQVKNAGSSASELQQSKLGVAEGEQAENKLMQAKEGAATAAKEAATAEGAAKDATINAEANVMNLKKEGSIELTRFKLAIDDLKKAEATKLEAKSAAELAVQNAKDAQEGAKDAAAAKQAVGDAEEALTAATGAADAATTAVTDKTAEQTKYEADHAKALDTAKKQVTTDKNGLAAAQSSKIAKDKAKTEAETAAAEGQRELVKAKDKFAAAANGKGEQTTLLAEMEKKKAELQQTSDEAANKAKEATEEFDVLEQKAAQEKHKRGIAIGKEEKALVSGAQKARALNAVKWDEHFESLKGKVKAVSEMYKGFVKCVKDSKWIC